MGNGHDHLVVLKNDVLFTVEDGGAELSVGHN